MKKVLLLTIVALFAASVLGYVAYAAEVEQSATASSSYTFERLGIVASNRPVANYTLRVPESHGLSTYAWGQVGDQSATELDLGQTYSGRLGPVQTRGEAAVYLSPVYKPVYSASVGVSLPVVEKFTINLDAQQYVGGFQNTLVAVGVSHPVGPGTLTLGKAMNLPSHRNPWFLQASVPMNSSERAPILGIRGFWGAGKERGSGVVIDITFSF